MTNAGYVFAGYGIVFATLVVYTVRTLLRGRALSKQLPPEDRRWM
jgi:CcmD family protein